jgi:hypothetical protein
MNTSNGSDLLKKSLEIRNSQDLYNNLTKAMKKLSDKKISISKNDKSNSNNKSDSKNKKFDQGMSMLDDLKNESVSMASDNRNNDEELMNQVFGDENSAIREEDEEKEESDRPRLKRRWNNKTMQYEEISEDFSDESSLRRKRKSMNRQNSTKEPPKSSGWFSCFSKKAA